jgi:hypothetical protein
MLIAGGSAAVLLFAAASARGTGAANHPELPRHEQLLAALDSGKLGLATLRALGLSVFTTPFNAADGFGDGPFDADEVHPLLPGQRPTLQGNGLLLRVNGLDAQSCNECHSIVSHATRPPTLGLAGVGGTVSNALILPSVVDVADSADDRVAFRAGHEPPLPLEPDGVADFNGRFANPPFLYGGGGVELLAREMTADLQALLAIARTAPPGTATPLESHGVHFGFLLTREDGSLDLSGVEGIGPDDPAGHPPQEVLVVRPFGRKGENFSMRDFARGAMRFHFGIEPVEVVDPERHGGVDADGDGVSDELTVAEMTALHVFGVTNPPPSQTGPRRLVQAGLDLFLELGCGDCHRPFLETRSRRLPLAYPELPSEPAANVYLEIDLVRVGFRPTPRGGVRVPLFADLKRHDMGPRLAESAEGFSIGNAVFTTARLWGVADTAPYLHDGRASTLFDAIAWHGGEARAPRDAFLALSAGERELLLGFLGTLRTPEAPNEELVPILRALERRRGQR